MRPALMQWLPGLGAAFALGPGQAGTLPAQAPWLDSEGAVRIVGYNDMREMIEALNTAFARAHPGIRFSVDLRGTRTGPAALASGRTVFAPMGAEFSDAALADYRAATGSVPLMVRVAHASLNPRALSAPLGLFVHRDNPLQAITLEQAARAFSVRQGDAILRWGQLGLTGEWSERPVRLCGLGSEYALGDFLSKHHFDGAPFVPAMASFPQSAQAVQCVAGDPWALGFAAANRVQSGVKALAVARGVGQPAVPATADEVTGGHYPLDRHLYIAVRKLPGQGIEPFVCEYLKLALSQEGQRLIAGGSLGYLPLNGGEVAQELAALDCR